MLGERLPGPQSVEAIEDPNKTRDKKQRATLGNPGG
jgi:hypothetical protein